VIYVAFRPTADTYLTQFFTTEGGNTHFAHYSAIDDAVAKARTTTDADEQAKLWQDANTQILKDYAAYPFLIKNLVYARSNKVDYGHELKSIVQLYPGIDETTSISSCLIGTRRGAPPLAVDIAPAVPEPANGVWLPAAGRWPRPPVRAGGLTGANTAWSRSIEG
jgi:hypothetical protein